MPSDNALDDQVIGGSGCADAHAKVEPPLWTQIDVNGRKKLLLLIVEWTEVRDRPPGTVILQPASDSFSDVIAELEIGREHYTLVHARAMKRAVERGLKLRYQAANFLVDDGTDFPGPGVS